MGGDVFWAFVANKRKHREDFWKKEEMSVSVGGPVLSTAGVSALKTSLKYTFS